MNDSNKEKEEWRDVPNYEGCYMVSNLGRLKSMDRTITYKDGRKRFCKGGFMKASIANGYKMYGLSINGDGRTFSLSQLVAMAFLGHKPDGHNIVVDHINGNKLDDRAVNLRLVTQRANSSTCFRCNDDRLSSTYIGVSWSKETSKWMSGIQYKGKRIHLGLFDNEIDASITYNRALSEIENKTFNTDAYKPKRSSKYKGITFAKKHNKWYSSVRVNGVKKHLGSFASEADAYRAQQREMCITMEI